MSTVDSRSTDRELVLRSLHGDEGALGELLAQQREWLKQVAAARLNGRASGRIDASDVVQQTLLSAFHRFEQFEGSTSEAFAAWLDRIHQHNIQDVLRRHVGAQKRSTGRERPLAAGSVADAGASTPSAHAIRNERSQRLMQYLELLPEDQAEAVRLRHLEGWSLVRIAEHFGRSTDSAASLLKRGVENLRRRIRDD